MNNRSGRSVICHARNLMKDASLSCIPCVRTEVKSIPHKAAFLGHLLLKNLMIFSFLHPPTPTPSRLLSLISVLESKKKARRTAVVKSLPPTRPVSDK
jgi:hypothetical protein